jgi:hypothetical protein
METLKKVAKDQRYKCIEACERLENQFSKENIDYLGTIQNSDLGD